MDLSKQDLSNKNFEGANIKNVNFEGACLKGASFMHAIIDNCDFRGADFTDGTLEHAVFHGCDMTGADVSGVNFHAASMNDTILTDVKDSEDTKFFRQRCPETGAFLGYKKLQNDRIAMLLIPADAKRTSATLNTCRCSKAKVMYVRSFDQKEHFDFGIATINDEFVYKVGEWVYADSFEDNRWIDATHGIHFWMSFEEAIGY